MPRVCFLFFPPLTLNKMKKKVLIADGAEINIKLVSHLLEKSDYKVVSTMFAKDVLKLAQNEKPGLILLDINTPGGDAFITLNQIVENELTKDIPVVIYTSVDYCYYIELALALGAKDYFVRPVNNQSLVQKINKYYFN